MIDSNLIDAVKAGDRESFGKVIDICLEPCLLLAVRLVGRRLDAEDIVQESFLKIWEKRSTIRQPDSFIPWVRKIVVNRCYDHLRARSRRRESDGNIAYLNDNNLFSNDNADRPLAEKEVSRLLEWIGGRLSTKQRLVFVLSEIEGMSNSEISKLTGMTSFSVKSNRYHAREKVKMIFEKMERRDNGKL